MVEQEDSKKRKRADDRLKDLLEHNAKLSSYISHLEFTLLSTSKKHEKSKTLFKTQILHFAEALDLSGYTVPPLPHKHLCPNPDLLSQIQLIKSTLSQESLSKPIKKQTRAKKDTKIESQL